MRSTSIFSPVNLIVHVGGTLAVELSQKPLTGASPDFGGFARPTYFDFLGLTTFANIPYVSCLSDSSTEKYDIAILGAPFDTVYLVLSFVLFTIAETNCRAGGDRAPRGQIRTTRNTCRVWKDISRVGVEYLHRYGATFLANFLSD